jgi:TolA-binding protein
VRRVRLRTLPFLLAVTLLSVAPYSCIVTSETLRQELLQMKESIKTNEAAVERINRESVEQTKSRDEKMKADIIELRALIARMSTRIDEISDDLARSKGAAEEREYSTRRATEPVAARIAPLEKKIAELSALNTTILARLDALQKQAAEMAQEKPQVWKSDEEAYEAALDAYRKGAYKDSIGRFDEVIRLFPKSKLAGNCIYWQGEAHFALKEFREAIDGFGAVIEKHPEARRFPPPT